MFNENSPLLPTKGLLNIFIEIIITKKKKLVTAKQKFINNIKTQAYYTGFKPQKLKAAQNPLFIKTG